MLYYILADGAPLLAQRKYDRLSGEPLVLYRPKLKKHQTIVNASRLLVVFCKPILAMLLQRKRLIDLMHRML